MKIQDGGGHHLEFGKNVTNSGWINISAPNYMRRCINYEKMHHGHAEITT